MKIEQLKARMAVQADARRMADDAAEEAGAGSDPEFRATRLARNWVKCRTPFFYADLRYGVPVYVAMQRDRRKAVFLQRLVKGGDIALAVAEHDRVLQVLGLVQQLAQRLALLEILSVRGDQALRDRGCRRRRARLRCYTARLATA